MSCTTLSAPDSDCLSAPWTPVRAAVSGLRAMTSHDVPVDYIEPWIVTTWSATWETDMGADKAGNIDVKNVNLQIKKPLKHVLKLLFKNH